ncbi:MAG: hypothetical protein V4772_08760 [Pseudomonadota bacterium]
MSDPTKDLLAIADTLEWHQKWRQSNNEGPMLHPRILTKALDDAIKFIRASVTSEAGQPLTDEQIDAAYRKVWSRVPRGQRITEFARAIESAVRAQGDGWLDISTAPTSEAQPFLVLRRGVVIQVSWFQGRLYPDARECCIDWDDGITDATLWKPLPVVPDNSKMIAPPNAQGAANVTIV